MNVLQHILIFFVRVYRWVLSPAKLFLFGPSSRCRFTPSCSDYALEALKRHGVSKGGALALRRVCRCHPWGGCGADPVPDLEASQAGPENLRSAEHCTVQTYASAGTVSQH